MKKLTCTLLVAMFTMTSMLFAQVTGGEIIEMVDYITVTNTSTKESKNITTKQFSSDGNNQYSYDVDFCLGVYKDDKIEVTYTVKSAILNPKVVWSYSWNNESSYNPETALTANWSVSNVPYNGSTLTVTCNYQGNGQSGTSRFYNINLKNVHNEARIQVKRDNKDFIISYLSYDEALSCIKQGAEATLYTASGTSAGTLITRSSFHAYGDVGVAILSPGNYSAPYIVNVTVNNTLIFTGQYR